MSEPDKKPDEEMSMEDILSSIRKIISEEQEQADADALQADDGGKTGSFDPVDEAGDEVLDLTDDLIEDVDLDDDDLENIDALVESVDADIELTEEDILPEHVVAGAAEDDPVDDDVFDLDDDMVEFDDENDDDDVLILAAADEDMIEDDPEQNDQEQETAAETPSLDDIPQFLTELQDALDDQTERDEDLEIEDMDKAEGSASDAEADDANRATEETIEEEEDVMEAAGQKILSPEAALKTSSAFDQLAQTLTSGYEGENNTLEGLVRELLRPMMQEWLDANLPDLVEKMVRSEIERLSR